MTASLYRASGFLSLGRLRLNRKGVIPAKEISIIVSGGTESTLQRERVKDIPLPSQTKESRCHASGDLSVVLQESRWAGSCSPFLSLQLLLNLSVMLMIVCRRGYIPD